MVVKGIIMITFEKRRKDPDFYPDYWWYHLEIKFCWALGLWIEYVPFKHLGYTTLFSRHDDSQHSRAVGQREVRVRLPFVKINLWFPRRGLDSWW